MITKALVLIVGLAAIGFILWWFFGKHTTATVTADGDADLQQVDVEVNGGYSPEQVVLKQGVPAVLNFTRKDASGCLDHVVFSDFGINRELPQNQTQTVTIDTSKAGEYQWACGMDMFHGKVIIK
ncbi:cupredoxin domain-containing protein [Lactiplantibacillus pentosus]|uniref:cupredoxin domain-containing protein n=1 Tax=Lactiplantibacillus pentosus TaxID=1589 RepID=UPI000B544C02|nr:cupredoxin domain-containing protein [Lactiplantibacillus pentosus]ASG80361.1 copper-binding protein [Lactiplantibacillus pentosus]MDO7805536.1 cupredoxin domain-containing protein [Lactiplantibacillus pentosus]